MKEWRGLYFPDGETHLMENIAMPDNAISWHGKPTYQFRKFQAAFQYIRNFRHAVDVGSHIGLWSQVLADCFTTLSAFEPTPEYRDCFEKNLQDRYNWKLYPYALSFNAADVELSIDPWHSGSTHIRSEHEEPWPQTIPAQSRRMDDFSLRDVDFIKIDTEGWELHVVQGAEITIKTYHPTIIVEQKESTGAQRRYHTKRTAAVELLQSWGGMVEWEVGGDFCVRWKR